MLNKNDLTYLKKYLKENKTPDGINIDLFTLNKIEEMIDLLSLQELPVDDKKYNISFMYDYLNVKGVTIEKFAKYLGIKKAHVYRLLNGELLINSTHLNKILELFKVDSYEQLQELVRKDLKRIKTYDIDMDYLRQFLKENKISNLVFANYLGIKKAHVYRLLNGGLKLKPFYKDKINTLFTTEEIIKELANESNISRKHNTNSEAYDISFLHDYLKDKKISQNSIAKILGISRQYMSILLNGQETINEDKLNVLLELFSVESYEELQELVNINEKQKAKKI